MRLFRRLFQNVSPTKPPARQGRLLLSCVPLESRIAPDAKPRLVSPVGSTSLVSGTEIVAEVHSSNPIQDLANITRYLGLASVVNLAQSSVVFSNGPLSYLSIALQPGASPTAVVASYAPVTSFFSWVAPNYIYATSDLTASTYLEKVPNDPLYSQQWHLPLVNAPAAWDTTYGDPNLLVSVFDDGIDITNPDLQANIYHNPNENAANGLDNDQNGYVGDVSGWNFASNNNNVLPDNPLTDTHGTQVAGLLAASIDNAVGVAGLAGRVKILPIKVVGNGTLTSLSMARAAAYSVMMGAKIITCSINIDPLVGDASFESTANFVYNRGLLWFNSAGNSNAANPPRQSFEQFLLVSATNSNNQKASYSNYGTGIDISAPGGDIGNGLSTTTTVAAGTFGTAYGTSMAAPLAAATAALVWSAHPGFSRDQVASRIMATATNLDPFNTSYVGQLGSGLINAGDAVNVGSVTTTMGPVSGLPTS
ncbi:MAG: S8 family serine peptidase [Gemmataceae bacterium]